MPNSAATASTWFGLPMSAPISFCSAAKPAARSTRPAWSSSRLAARMACGLRAAVLRASARAAVRGWGLEILCQDPAVYSPILTGVVMPAGHYADAFRKVALENFNISYGAGLGKVAGKVFRIGHLGDLNEPMILGTLATVELAMKVSGVPHTPGGVDAAIAALA